MDGYVPVDSATLETRFPGVYAIGDVATAGHAQGRRLRRGRGARPRDVARLAPARQRRRRASTPGTGSCYIEFGAGRIGRVDIDFLSGPSPTGTYHAPSLELRSDKQYFGSSRRARWFGRTS